MANYTPNEIVDMILVLEECQHNMKAAWLYREIFLDCRHLSDVMIQNCEFHARRRYLHQH